MTKMSFFQILGFSKPVRIALAFALLFVGSVGFYACQQKDVASEGVKPASRNVRGNKNGTVNNWRNTVIANSQNPLDSIGYHHNLALEYVIARLNRNDMNNSIVNLTVSYGCSIAPSIQNCSTTFLPIAQLGATVNVDNFDTSILTQIGLSKYNELITMLRNVDEETFTLSNIQQDVIQWESSIQTLAITQQEKNILLVGGAVARYSTAYWVEEINLGDSEWFPSGGLVLEKGFWKNLFKCLGADLSGAMTGMGASVVIGPLGAGVGAIIGGAAASCAMAGSL